MRRRGKAAIGAAGLAIAVVLIGIPVLVTPATDDAQTIDVDVAYVIGPPTEARMDAAHELIADGRAEALMVSLDPEEGDRWTEAAAACQNGGLRDGRLADDTALSDVEVLCHKPEPFTTRGEARWLEDEMAEHGWDSAAVITLTPHISRARMIMERCETGDIAMVDPGESLAAWYWAYMYAYQAAGFTKAAILQGC
ncbi:hypothetical protein [Demequina sp. SO4-18]|uniref:hypothetical protein n=1 Tax=Demequina sp. SO4-18 TaxID=3401026 RepID=UPI003B59D48C